MKILKTYGLINLTNMDQTEQFVDFLTKHNALDKFIKNLNNPQGYLPSKFCIDVAFVWERTSEGFYYWLCLSNEWASLAKDNSHISFEEVILGTNNLWED